MRTRSPVLPTAPPFVGPPEKCSSASRQRRLVLQVEDVREFTIEPIGPDVLASLRLDELARDAQKRAGTWTRDNRARS